MKQLSLAFIAILLLFGAFPVQVSANDSIMQVVYGGRIRPDSMASTLSVISYSKWIYVVDSDFPEAVGHVLQFEKTDADTLKYVKTVTPLGVGQWGPSGYFFGDMHIKTMKNGNGIAYLSISEGYNASLIRFDVEPVTGNWSPRDTINNLGGWFFFSPDDKFFYCTGAQANPQIQGFSIDQTTGDMTRLTGLPKNDTLWWGYYNVPACCITSDGNFMYIGSQISYEKYAVVVFKRNPITGIIDTASQRISVQPNGGYLQLAMSPNDLQLIVTGSCWEFYNRNPVDGSLSLDTIVNPPGNINGGEYCRFRFPYKTVGYAYGGHHHGGSMYTFAWDTLKGGKGLNSPDKFTHVHSMGHWQKSLEIDTVRQVYYFGCFQHLNLPARDNFDSNYVVTMKMNNPYKPAPHTATEKSELIISDNALKIEPNPFNPSTVLSFTVKSTARVTLNVFDLAGKLVSPLVDSRYPAGKHQVVFDARRLSSGIYVCRLAIGDRVSVRRVVLTK